ncbi:hypothetical protein PoB_000758300 [Plakobranchus ocellatus]|uniref:Uncharacterized protein n=1 Tax=Plakobranchus ocellatus TaxID=259542 RepID=A0AAV3YF23_9GAST|nr:hypothetical protein PoB_000758300 [Plakobranchus ocellatus]
MMKRGRPKGADLTVIGLAKRRKVTLESQPQPFVTFSDKDKKMIILRMIVREKGRVASNKLLTVFDIAVNLPSTLFEDVIDVQRVQKYFERGAFLVLSSKLEHPKE